jgi:hypothetical protein
MVDSLLFLRLSNAKTAYLFTKQGTWAENYWRGVVENLQLKADQINNNNTKKVRDENNRS